MSESLAPTDPFERKRALRGLRRDLDAHPEEPILGVVIRSAIRFGAFASFLDAATRQRLLDEAGDYHDFYLYKALMDDGGAYAPSLSAREKLALEGWLES